MSISLTEQRFREGKGVPYCGNGHVRCQAVSVSQVRRWREEYEDDVTPITELWPECQCPNPAIEGFFVCQYHGGKSIKKLGHIKSFYDVIPVDMREIVRAISENPAYIDRKDDIILLQTLVWDRLSELGEDVGSPEAWSMVKEARLALNRGDEDVAAMLINKALESKENKVAIRKEILETEKVLKDLTRTQVNTAEKLRMMVTAEQVTALLHKIQYLIQDAGKQYIAEPRALEGFYADVSNGLRQFSNFSFVQPGDQLRPGTPED